MIRLVLALWEANDMATMYSNGEILKEGAVFPMTESDSTLRLIAFIFNLISTITASWALIPLAWMIPMTVISWKIYKGTRPNTTAFGVCTLIFVNLVGGILLLCSKKDA